MIQTLIASGLVFAVSGLFAVVLLVAERFLVRYGQCKIDINNGQRELEIPGGENLLISLKNVGIFVPSACGGKGTCSYCKVKILEGGGPLGPTEEPLLTSEEIRDNVRVSCQCKVRNDLKIELPEKLFSIRQFRGRVEMIRNLTHDIKELRIKLVDPQKITFVPGQYVQLEVPAYGSNREPVFRAYSISSPPYMEDAIELIVRFVPGGICTTWVFEHLKEGDDVNFTGPYGDFRLSQRDGEMVWIAGGSGMAPFWSMIRHMKHNNLSRPCRYFFGAVKERDMFLIDELRQMEKELSWFRFLPALSGLEEESKWQGDRGLITEVVGRHVEGPDNREGYLCGSPGMIDAAIEVLKAKGITDDRIFFDKF